MRDMKCPCCNGSGFEKVLIEADRNDGNVFVEESQRLCRNCNGAGVVQFTNGDYIRSMSDERLIDFIGAGTLCEHMTVDSDAACPVNGDCKACLKNWLNSPYDSRSLEPELWCNVINVAFNPRTGEEAYIERIDDLERPVF